MPQIVFDGIAFTVATSIAFVAWMWWLVWLERFPVPIFEVAKIFAIAFSIQLLIYVTYTFFALDIQLRAHMVRASIVVICLSQAIPLFVAYRTWRYGQSHP